MAIFFYRTFPVQRHRGGVAEERVQPRKDGGDLLLGAAADLGGDRCMHRGTAALDWVAPQAVKSVRVNS